MIRNNRGKKIKEKFVAIPSSNPSKNTWIYLLIFTGLVLLSAITMYFGYFSKTITNSEAQQQFGFKFY